MKVFITGGSGYIGSVVVRRLLERGDRVMVFDNLERGHRCNVPAEAELIVGDLRDEKAILQAMRETRPDAVVHFAAYALVGESMQDPQMYFDNIETIIRDAWAFHRGLLDFSCRIA